MHTASGEAITWLDSDDYWELNHLETGVPLGRFDESERYSVDFDAQLIKYPEKQWAATYRFRKRTLDDVRRDGQHDIAEELEALFRKRWNADVHTASDRGQGSWLRRPVELGSIVPDIPGASTRKWAPRSRIPASVVEVVRAYRERRKPSLRRKRTAA